METKKVMTLAEKLLSKGQYWGVIKLRKLLDNDSVIDMYINLINSDRKCNDIPSKYITKASSLNKIIERCNIVLDHYDVIEICKSMEVYDEKINVNGLLGKLFTSPFKGNMYLIETFINKILYKDYDYIKDNLCIKEGTKLYYIIRILSGYLTNISDKKFIADFKEVNSSYMNCDAIKDAILGNLKMIKSVSHFMFMIVLLSDLYRCGILSHDEYIECIDAAIDTVVKNFDIYKPFESEEVLTEYIISDIDYIIDKLYKSYSETYGELAACSLMCSVHYVYDYNYFKNKGDELVEISNKYHTLVLPRSMFNNVTKDQLMEAIYKRKVYNFRDLYRALENNNISLNDDEKVKLYDHVKFKPARYNGGSHELHVLFNTLSLGKKYIGAGYEETISIIDKYIASVNDDVMLYNIFEYITALSYDHEAYVHFIDTITNNMDRINDVLEHELEDPNLSKFSKRYMVASVTVHLLMLGIYTIDDAINYISKCE